MRATVSTPALANVLAMDNVTRTWASVTVIQATPETTAPWPCVLTTVVTVQGGDSVWCPGQASTSVSVTRASWGTIVLSM